MPKRSTSNGRRTGATHVTLKSSKLKTFGGVIILYLGQSLEIMKIWQTIKGNSSSGVVQFTTHFLKLETNNIVNVV